MTQKSPLDLVGFTIIAGAGFCCLCLKHVYLKATSTPKDEFNKIMGQSAINVVSTAEKKAPIVTNAIKRIFLMS